MLGKQPNKVEKFLEKAGEIIDPIGKKIFGSFWRDVYETLQDAIALCFLFSIPGWISKLVLGDDYSSFDQCYKSWNSLNVNRYACYVIVGSGFVLWLVVGGRILGKFLNKFGKWMVVAGQILGKTLKGLFGKNNE